MSDASASKVFFSGLASGAAVVLAYNAFFGSTKKASALAPAPSTDAEASSSAPSTVSERGGLSMRGHSLAFGGTLPYYLLEHFGRLTNPFDSEKNPDGYISLAIAENRLMEDLLLPELSKHRSEFNMNASHMAYPESMCGTNFFRTCLARFMERHVINAPANTIAASDLAVLAGCGTCVGE